ncbi:MAG: 16S rRNA (cytidine(1402)-2'-O)-methyltransferase [Luteibaculaceae bacterium]
MKLYLVPTPIGNLEDITLRAIRVLKEVDVIFAEDTRVALKLLNHLGIEKKVIPFHIMNEHKSLQLIQSFFLKKQIVAYISDAGMPGISDPGYLLAKHCVENNVPLEALPGPSAFVQALVESGLPTHNFIFEGFLPHKKGRATKLKLLAEEDRTIVLYESPHRLLKALKEFCEYLGENRPIAVCRELTKMFHEVYRGTVQEALTYFEKKGVKGEFVLVIAGKKFSEKANAPAEEDEGPSVYR